MIDWPNATWCSAPFPVTKILILYYSRHGAVAEMANLAAKGVESVDDLYKDVPESAFVDGVVDLPKHQGEMDVERDLKIYANQNHAAPDGPFFLGAALFFLLTKGLALASQRTL